MNTTTYKLMHRKANGRSTEVGHYDSLAEARAAAKAKLGLKRLRGERKHELHNSVEAYREVVPSLDPENRAPSYVIEAVTPRSVLAGAIDPVELQSLLHEALDNLLSQVIAKGVRK